MICVIECWIGLAGNYRLLYRSRQRGFLELDLVLGRWVEEHIHSMDVDGVKALVGVLDLVTISLYNPFLSVSVGFDAKVMIVWLWSSGDINFFVKRVL